MTESCQLCKFYKSYGDFGECLRYPPTMVQEDEVVSHGHKDEYRRVSRKRSPYMWPSEWCGEFKITEPGGR